MSVYPHTLGTLGLYAHSYACVCVCVYLHSAHSNAKTIKKHFVYCGIEALIRFASVWFGLLSFCFVFAFALFLSVLVWVFGCRFYTGYACHPACRERERARGSRAALFTTPQLPPPFVIELIPATGLHCTAIAVSIISCHTMEIWLRFFSIFNLVFTSSKLNQFSIAQLTTATHVYRSQ